MFHSFYAFFLLEGLGILEIFHMVSVSLFQQLSFFHFFCFLCFMPMSCTPSFMFCWSIISYDKQKKSKTPSTISYTRMQQKINSRTLKKKKFHNDPYLGLVVVIVIFPISCADQYPISSRQVHPDHRKSRKPKGQKIIVL